MADRIQLETRGRVRLITIDRPERRNAVDAETATALHEAFVDFDVDEDVDVAVLSGAGGNFCAGADLHTLPEEVGDRLTETGIAPMGHTRLSLSKPVVAAIEGYAVAGGLEIAIWCDLRVASETAKLGVLCRRFGVPLVDGGTVRLPRLIGHGRAMDLILTGREVGASEAKQMGLVNRVVPEGSAVEAAVALAAEIAEFPQQCLRNDRRSAIEQWSLSESEAMLAEIRLGLATIASGETVSGARAFSSGQGRHGQRI